MSRCCLQCDSCVGEALSASGDAHVAATGCTFEAGRSSSCEGGSAVSVCTGILSQHAPVVAEHCAFAWRGGDSGCVFEGVRLQGAVHLFASCDWHRCSAGAVLTDEASVQLQGCSWTQCAVGLQAASKSRADAAECVLLRNHSGLVLEEGAHARFSSCQFAFNRVAAAARTASLHLQSSCCIFDAVALIFDKRSTATLADCAFFGSGTAAVASDDDVRWLLGAAAALSATAAAAAADAVARARGVERAQQERGSCALQIVCAVKSVSSVTWCAALSASVLPHCDRKLI
jgi:hypothetical protein